MSRRDALTDVVWRTCTAPVTSRRGRTRLLAREEVNIETFPPDGKLSRVRITVTGRRRLTPLAR